MMDDIPIKSQLKNRFFAITDAMRQKLVKTHPTITDHEAQRRSQLLASLTLAMAATTTAAVGLLGILYPDTITDLDSLLFLSGAAAMLLAYLLNRAGYYRQTAILTAVVLTIVTTIAPFLPESGPELLTAAIAPILLIAFIYSPRASVLAAAVIVVVSAVLVAVTPHINKQPYVVTLLVITIIDAIILVFMFHQRALEKERRQQLALANKELRQSEMQLEQRVQARTRDLEQARAEAERANELKSQFLASVSHELRTPLNSVINFTQFVASGLYGPVNQKQIDALGKATNSGRHLLQIINDILYMSKIEDGRVDLRIEENIRVQDELEGIYKLTRTLLGDKPVAVTKEIASDLPAIAGDRQRIHQILFNLAANAAKYTDAGFIHVKAWGESNQIVISIQDTGTGIPVEDQDAIFKPFRQLKRIGGSTAGIGLGLAIAYWLVEAHGGQLWLESRPGQGSTFFVSFPIEEADSTKNQVEGQS